MGNKLRTKAPASDLLTLPGIGKTFIDDFARIGIHSIAELKGKDPEKLFARLVEQNARLNHRTSKNYLYVLRMAVYCASLADPFSAAVRWSDFKDAE